jgi:hypothetical protein
MNDWRNATENERQTLQPAIDELAVGGGSVFDHQVREWASVTFKGARHRMKVRFEGEQAIQNGELFVAFLPEHEFDIPRLLVADAAILNITHEIGRHLEAQIELLTLDDQP